MTTHELARKLLNRHDVRIARHGDFWPILDPKLMDKYALDGAGKSPSSAGEGGNQVSNPEPNVSTVDPVSASSVDYNNAPCMYSDEYKLSKAGFTKCKYGNGWHEKRFLQGVLMIFGKKDGAYRCGGVEGCANDFQRYFSSLEEGLKWLEAIASMKRWKQ